MTEARRGVRGLAVEMVVIVVSILIAFALDAWWDGRKESVTHRENLLSLRAEIERSLTLIERADETLDNSLTATEFLLGLTGPDPEIRGIDSLNVWVYEATSLRTLELPSGAMEVVLATGDVNLIESDSLRVLIGEWPARVLDVREGYEWIRADRDEVWEPLIGRHVRLRDVLLRPRNRHSPSRFHSDMVALLSDPEFEDRLAERVQAAGSTKEELAALTRVGRLMLTLLEEELR